MSTIDDLQRLHEAATKGPWHWWQEDGSFRALSGPDDLEDHVLWAGICGACRKRQGRCTAASDENEALIASLRNAWPAIHRVILAASDLVASHPASPMEMQALMLRLKKELWALDDKEQRT